MSNVEDVWRSADFDYGSPISGYYDCDFSVCDCRRYNGQSSDPIAPHNWIFDLDNPAAPPFVRSSVRQPKTVLQKFNGDPRRWPLFIQSFMMHLRLFCLHNMLSAEIQNTLGDKTLVSSRTPHSIWQPAALRF